MNLQPCKYDCSESEWNREDCSICFDHAESSGHQSAIPSGKWDQLKPETSEIAKLMTFKLGNLSFDLFSTHPSYMQLWRAILLD